MIKVKMFTLLLLAGAFLVSGLEVAAAASSLPKLCQQQSSGCVDNGCSSGGGLCSADCQCVHL